MNWKRTALATIAFVAGGAVPIQLVTLSFGYAEYVRGITKQPQVIRVAHEFAQWYIPFIYIPALVILLGIVVYSGGIRACFGGSSSGSPQDSSVRSVSMACVRQAYCGVGYRGIRR